MGIINYWSIFFTTSFLDEISKTGENGQIVKYMYTR